MLDQPCKSSHESEPVSAHTLADWLTIETLLNCYARDFAGSLRDSSVAALWDRPPAHDATLRARWLDCQHKQWLRLAFEATGEDVFCPVVSVSDSGRHRLARPVVARHRGSGSLRELSLDDILDCIIAQYRAEAALSDSAADRIRRRLRQSREVLTLAIEHRRAQPLWMSDVWPRFIEAEQSLLAGHPFHPLAKSRWGFSPEEVRRYSPEFQEEFQLHYFLAHPSIVLEDCVGELAALDLLKEELSTGILTPPHAQELLKQHAAFRVVPTHPWEARHLLQDERVAAAMAAGLLISLGPLGAPFTATSSTRTVYRRNLPFMLKLSLHVGITNCERINYLHELRKGCAVARLMESPWGRRFTREVPGLRILCDTGYVTLQWQGKILDGFSTLVRENPLRDDARIAVAAALCEPPLVGRSLLHELIAEVSDKRHLSLADAAVLWFERYLDLFLGSLVAAYDSHGMALELHVQNLLVEMDSTGLPERLYYRDNQGFFFRNGHAAELVGYVPELADISPCVLPESMLHIPIAYYILVNNILGVLQAFGAQGLCGEDVLLGVLAQRLRRIAAVDSTDFIGQILRARGWPAKGNLRMVLEDHDELTRPVENPATYLEIDNPVLPLYHSPCKAIVAPDGLQVVHSHVFADYGATMWLRPMSIERDLELVHGWVNDSYAKTFWCMDGPIRNLEAVYIEMLASPYTHAFIGHLDDKPAFLIETYWAPRDIVGRYYDVQPDDYGFHFLVAPPRVRLPRFTTRACQVAVEFLFRHPEVGRVISEPDHRNTKAVKVMSRVGYEIERVIQLPDKEASLMFCTRERLVRHCPDARPYIAQPGVVSLTVGQVDMAPSMLADER